MSRVDMTHSVRNRKARPMCWTKRSLTVLLPFFLFASLLQANAEVYNVDTDRIAAVGYSTGGQLASLLGLTTPLDGLEGEGGFPAFSSRVQVVVSNYGIYDLKEWYKNGNPLAQLSLNTFL